MRKCLIVLARPAGIEPATTGLEGLNNPLMIKND